MKLTKEIFLTAYTVTVVDIRQPKPSPQHTESIVIDGGTIRALRRLGQSAAGYIESKYNAAGYGLVSIAPAGSLTASVDLSSLWDVQRAASDLATAQKHMDNLLKEGAAECKL